MACVYKASYPSVVTPAPSLVRLERFAFIKAVSVFFDILQDAFEMRRTAHRQHPSYGD
jgi:hypothetical protein